jgi:membrane protein implicated in regulation of membrane protease activity
VSTPPQEPPGEHHDPQADPAREQAYEPHCPRCGAPHDPLQEYCLECGLRLVPLPRTGSTVVWSRESPVWLWIALAALLLVALAAGAIVALAATDDDENAAAGVSSSDADTSVVPTVPTTISIDTFTTPSTITLPTTSTSSTTTGTTTSSTTTTSPTTTGTGTIISWPSGKNGYTIIVRSTPTSQGRGPAESAAHQAINAGLPQVGILNSSDYSSMNPGYYVTFTGVYDTQSQAQSALPNARSKGFPTAYVRRVAD